MSAQQQLNAKPLTVLLVEDNEEDALLLERYLRRAALAPEITRVETTEEMAAALNSRGEGWDIVLADYNLPSFSAPAALEMLQTSGFDIPFIMMSGAVSEETAVAAMRAGAQDYVTKQNLARLVPAIEREVAEAAGRRRKRVAEQALRQSEQRFHRLVEAMPLALFICDSSGRIIYVNDGFESLLGFSRMDVEAGALTLERILEGSPESAMPLLKMWSQSGTTTFEIECSTKGRETVPVLIGASVLNPELPLEQRQIAAFLADLTEQKHSHEVLRRTEKLAAAGRLAASIAHEINNPLEAVTNCMYLLSKGNLDESARTYLELAQSELDRVTHITTQTLRFYRQSTRPVETDVHELLETVLALYDARLRSHSIKVTRQFHEVPLIIAYDGEVRQVLANLVGNSLDAMQQSGGRLLLRISRARDWKTGEPGVSVTVADTGPGMDSYTLGRIYEPFFSTKGITGTGLGLWVSYEIVRKHHGSLRVRTRQGVSSGTVFRLFMPLLPLALSSRSEDSLPASA